jgi:hypothetical protein
MNDEAENFGRGLRELGLKPFENVVIFAMFPVLSLPSNFWRNSKTSFQAPKTSTYWYTC